MKARRRQVLLGLCAATFLSAAPVAIGAAPKCPPTGNPDPCYRELDGNVREALAGRHDYTAVTPRRIADNLGTQAPSWSPDGAEYQIFYNDPLPNPARLLVFAPGQPDLPQNYRGFAKHAAEKGFTVLVLHYWNDKGDAAADLCNQTYALIPVSPVGGPYAISRDGCVTKLLDGWLRDFHALAPVHATTDSGKKLNAEDELVTRLRRTLAYLHKNFPGQGWNKFAAKGGFDKQPFVNWSKVTLAGHSSGSKLVAHAAQVYAVQRVVLLSGPNAFVETAGGSVCPSAVAPAGVTKASEIYAYYSKKDPKAKYAEACHLALGLKPSAELGVNYAALKPHVIYNSADAASSCDCGDGSGHLSTAEDCALKPSKQGALAPTLNQTYAVWDYLLGV